MKKTPDNPSVPGWWGICRRRFIERELVTKKKFMEDVRLSFSGKNQRGDNPRKEGVEKVPD